MNLHKNHNYTLASLVLGAAAANASAGLIGDTVAMWHTPQLTGESSLRGFAVVADPGIEFSTELSGDVLYTLDLDATSIRLDTVNYWYSPWFNSGHAPSSIEIRGMDFGPGLSITGLDVTFSPRIRQNDSAPGDLPAFSADNIVFSGDTVRINYGGFEFFEGSWIQIDMIVTPAPAGVGVLAGAGLLACRRRRAL